MEDDAERVARTRAQAADAVAKVRAMEAARAPHRPVVDGKDHRVAVRQGHDLDPRLHARALLGEHELAALEIAPRCREEEVA